MTAVCKMSESYAFIRMLSFKTPLAASTYQNVSKRMCAYLERIQNLYITILRCFQKCPCVDLYVEKKCSCDRPITPHINGYHNCWLVGLFIRVVSGFKGRAALDRNLVGLLGHKNTLLWLIRDLYGMCLYKQIHTLPGLLRSSCMAKLIP